MGTDGRHMRTNGPLRLDRAARTMRSPMTALHPTASIRPPPRVIRNRLALIVGVFVLFNALATAGGFAMMGALIGGIGDQGRRTGLLAEAEEALQLSLINQEALVLGQGLTGGTGTLEEFEDAVAAETDTYIELGRIAPDDAEIQRAAANVRHLAASWRDEWAEPFLVAAAGGEQVVTAAALEENERLLAPVRDALAELNALKDERRAATSLALNSMVGNLQAIFVPVVAIMSILIASGGMWLIRWISGPLHRLNLTAQSLIAGEEVTFVPENDDEIGALSLVLERLRLDAAARYDEARDDAQTAATFNQLAELTSFAQNEQTLVEAATRVLQRIAPSPRGQIMLLNNSTNRLTVAAAWGDDMPEVGAISPVDRTDRCPGIRRATAYVADDVSDALAVRCPAHSAPSGTVVCLPMPALGSIVGVIHLERPEPGSFDGITVERAARTAEQVALALANDRLMKTMEGLANTDPLTGLRNARFFDTYLDQQFAVAQRDRESIGLIMVDVDNFKQFNDTYGHPAGDEALRALGRTVRSVLRASDVVARYGGEEFIIALHRTTLGDAATVAEKLRAAIEQTIVEIGPGRYGRITISLGVAATDSHRVDRKALVSIADAALYRAKAGGRNRVEQAPTSLTELHEGARQRKRRGPVEPLAFPRTEVPRAERASRRRPSRLADGGDGSA